MQYGELIKQVSELELEDFYETRDQVIFNAMLQMNSRGIPIDVLTITQYLKDKRLYEDGGGFEYLAYLVEIAISPANINYQVEKVKEASLNRNLWKKSERLKQAIERGEDEEEIRILQSQVSQWKSSSASKLKPISAKELEDVPPVESLWGEILFPECITQMNSEPGVGKSTLFYNLCAYGANEKDFLGVSFNRRIKSLYVDLETPRWKRREKLKSICDGDLPENLHFLNSLNLRSDFTDLVNLCKKEKYDLLIFDTQSRVFAMEKENDNSEATYLLGLLRQLTNESGCGIALIHHASKSEDSKGVYRGRGASAIAAGADIVINLEALDEETLKMTVAKNRIVGTNPVLFIRKAGEDKFESHTSIGGESGFEILRAQQVILSLENEKLTTREVCEMGKQKGFTEITMKRALSRLVEGGKLERLRKGEYQFRTPYQHRINNIKNITYIDDTIDTIPEVIA